MDTWARRTRGLPAILVAAGVPAAVIFLLNPLQIAWSNLQDMEAPIGALAVGALIATLTAFLLGAAALWGLEKIGFRRAVPLAMAAGFMFWLHSAVLVWDYGVLDGTNIDWRAHRVAGVIELGLWVGLLTWAAMRPQIVRRVGLRVLPALLLVSSMSVGMAALNAPEAPSFHSYSLSDENEHLFSKERNVIFMVLDAFQADVFAELLAENPELAEDFEDFTYYRNTVSGFAKTYPSPALMFSGEYYENREPLQQFLKRVYLEASVPAKLVAAGWDVGLYPFVSRTLYFDPRVASNVRLDRDENAALMETARLLDLGLFRAVPHVLKRRVVNDHQWRFRKSAAEWAQEHRIDTSMPGDLWRSSHGHHDVRLIEELERNGRVAGTQPVFRYFHFLAPHAPFLLNEELEMERLAGGREGFRRYSKIALQLVGRALDKFKVLGIYDNAAIFIVSDHGGGEYGAGVAKQYAGHAINANADADISRFEHASGLPLMLLKLPGAEHPLRVSDAPVSLADVAATLDALTLDAGGYPGTPVYEVAENAQRQRRYLFYKFDGWTAAYLPPLKEFLVEGFSWDSASWHATGTVLEGEMPPAEEANEPGIVAVNETVSTARDAAGVAALGDGWWTPEENSTWSRDKMSTLHFRFMQKLVGDVSVTLRLAPYLGRGKLERQRVIVRHDGKVLGELDVASFGNYTVIVPLGPEGTDALDLVLEVPDAMSPASALSSTDERVLGVGLHAFRIGSSGRIGDGEELHFGVRDNGPSLLRSGWSQSEPTMTWTDGSKARMHLPLAEELHGREVVLEFSLRPFIAPPKLTSQRVVLTANGEPVGEWMTIEGGKHSVVLPASVTAEGEVDLLLELPDAAVPFTVSQSTDMRMLGIALYELSVSAGKE